MGKGAVQLPRSWQNGLEGKLGFGSHPLVAFLTPFLLGHPGSSWMTLGSHCPTRWQPSRPVLFSQWPLLPLPLPKQKLVLWASVRFWAIWLTNKAIVLCLRASCKVGYRMQWIWSFDWDECCVTLLTWLLGIPSLDFGIRAVGSVGATEVTCSLCLLRTLITQSLSLPTSKLRSPSAPLYLTQIWG